MLLAGDGRKTRARSSGPQPVRLPPLNDRYGSAREEEKSGLVADDGNMSLAGCDVFQQDHVAGVELRQLVADGRLVRVDGRVTRVAGWPPEADDRSPLPRPSPSGGKGGVS